MHSSVPVVAHTTTACHALTHVSPYLPPPFVQLPPPLLLLLLLRPALVKLFKGHVAELLRHPCGADVLDDLYNVAPTSCRNTMCAELYGREFSLFGGVSAQGESISHLSQLLAGVDAAKRQAVLQALYKGLAPVLEKALLHPVMTHRLIRELLTEASG